jgi:ribosomal RNA-processing protein 8
VGQYGLAAGFREQTRGWPEQPVESALAWLSSKPRTWEVADLGCGDAAIAARAAQRVRSYDLVAGAPGVVACNIASLPLGAGAVEAAIFSLSLMGTDYGDFLAEAHRVLKQGGRLWIAEVQSRWGWLGGCAGA